MQNINQPAQKKKSHLGLIIFLVTILILVGAGVGGYFWAVNWYNSGIVAKNSDDKTVVKFEIKSGTSASDIGSILKEKKLIQDENLWLVYVKLNNPNFLADKYSMPRNLSIVDIAKVLEAGQKDEVVWVTIPEGLRMDEIEKILNDKLITIPDGKYKKDEFNKLVNTPDDFLSKTTSKSGAYILSVKPKGKSLEGFLFPDTYAFPLDSTANSVLTMLLENFQAKTKNITPSNGLSFYDSLVVASIVEREANPSDHAGVASVFVKRINMKEKLGSDITVLYILKRWKPEPTAQELRIESPYNTRKNYGIPPTPISNPGLSAISAMASAKAGENLFFLADEKGKIYYGKNITEHNQNICKYITKTCQ